MFFYHYTLFATESANSAVRFRTDIDAREHACCTARRPTGRSTLFRALFHHGVDDLLEGHTVERERASEINLAH
jgi:hypothetical protein